MHYTKKERVEIRKAFLRQLMHMKIDDAHRSLINGFFESYLHLNNKEVEKLMRELHPLSQEVLPTHPGSAMLSESIHSPFQSSLKSSRIEKAKNR